MQGALHRDISPNTLVDRWYSFLVWEFSIWHQREPSINDNPICIFHTSSPESSPMQSVAKDTGEMLLDQTLTVKYSQCLNRSLRKSCNFPEDTISSRFYHMNDLDAVPEAYQNPSFHDASQEARVHCVPAFILLSSFADQHLLHWFDSMLWRTSNRAPDLSTRQESSR